VLPFFLQFQSRIVSSRKRLFAIRANANAVQRYSKSEIAMWLLLFSSEKRLCSQENEVAELCRWPRMRFPWEDQDALVLRSASPSQQRWWASHRYEKFRKKCGTMLTMELCSIAHVFRRVPTNSGSLSSCDICIGAVGWTCASSRVMQYCDFMMLFL